MYASAHFPTSMELIDAVLRPSELYDRFRSKADISTSPDSCFASMSANGQERTFAANTQISIRFSAASRSTFAQSISSLVIGQVSDQRRHWPRSLSTIAP